MKRAYNWANDEGLLESIPLKKVRRPPNKRRERIPTEEERREILAAIRDEELRQFVSSMQETGARPGEWRKVRACDFREEMGAWVLPEHKTKKKTGRPRMTWTDRFNKRHSVTVPQIGTVTVRFPIATGGAWIWCQAATPRQQRTGFNANVTWVEAVLRKQDNHVRIQATGFLAPGVEPDPGFLGSIKDRVADVKAIVEAGARTIEEALRIANAAGPVMKP